MGFLSHLRQTQIETVNLAVDRQDRILSDYLAWLGEDDDHGTAERKLTVIARSAASSAIKALVARSGELRAEGVAVQVILSQLEPASALRDMKQALALVNDDREGVEYARWARNTALLDAHEQLTLGTHMCWSGDAMRREPGKRDSLDLFEACAPQTVRLGLLAFDAIWAVSEPVPGARRANKPNGKPLASLARPETTVLPRSTLLTRLNRLAATWH